MTRTIANLDMHAFESEMTRILPSLQAIGQDPEVGRHKVLDALPKAEARESDTRFRFEFLASPLQMLGENGLLTQLEIEDNTLIMKDGEVKSLGIGHKRILEVETVIFAIGDNVDESFGLPVVSNEFVKNPSPRFPMDGHSYEAFDTHSGTPIKDVFVGGWARKASDGLVGVARKDGINAAKAVWQYLESLPITTPNLAAITARMKNLGKPVVTYEEVKKLEAAEAAEAQKQGLVEFKFSSNEDMLQAIGLTETV